LNQAGQGLERLLKMLSNHSDLISDAYFNGVVYKDNQNQRAITQLKQLKILVNHSEDSYRISGRLGAFIDSALSSDRVRRLDTDLGSWIETLEQQISLYQDASAENRSEDSENYFAEIERLVFDLSDTLEENTRYLLMLVNSRFANVRTLAEKQKQNAFYISRLEKLVNAISSLQPELLLEMVEEQPIIYDLLEQQLIRLLPMYQQRLQDILDKLKIFLFELRQIEARAQLVQGFAFFLRQNPAFSPQDWSERDTIPNFFNQIKPLELFAHINPKNNALEEELIEIVQKLKTDAEALLAKQKTRTLNAVEVKPQQKQKLEMPWYRKQIKIYFHAVQQNHGQPLSALYFWQQAQAEIEPTIWLACVMNEGLRQQNKAFQMELRTGAMSPVFSGNQKITDIFLRYATA
jgi:hypothetical protein